jgi:hypothetical protein
VTTGSKTTTDFRIPTATKWRAPCAVADSGGGTIIAGWTTQQNALVTGGGGVGAVIARELAAAGMD